MMSKENALAFLRGALPVADQVTAGDELLHHIIDHAYAVRAETPWGDDIPGDLFRAFVLFPRINNEDARFYHAPIWRELKPRVIGKTITQAALEINHWCYEKATYQSTDMRTANALTVMRRGFGRCGEESVLLVSALRSAGIPARQVYVPRWAHCDDNHAWVEVWTGDGWHYMGACEPEPVLDSGWFTAAASKAMLVHTRVYDSAYAREPALPCAGSGLIINRTSTYAVTKPFRVRVTENGAPKKGVIVRFELCNAAQFYPIHQQATDESGLVTLELGLGTIRLHVHDGNRYCCRMADVRAQDECLINFAEATEFCEQASDFEQLPPPETRIQPSVFAPETAAAHVKRLREGEAIRERAHAEKPDNGFLQKARLNQGEITRFLTDERFAMQDKEALLGTLRDKDFADTTCEILTDALEAALPYQPRYPRDIWAQGVLNLRAGYEMLFPIRRALQQETDALRDAAEVWREIERRTRLVEMYPPLLYPNLLLALRDGRCDRAVRDALYVALCRAHGIAARLDPFTGEKEYYADGAYRALLPSHEATARVTLVSEEELRYGVDFTLDALCGGVFQPLDHEGLTFRGEKTLLLAPGRYRAVTSTRQIDGAVNGRVIPFAVIDERETRVILSLCEDQTGRKLLYQPLPPLRAMQDDARIALPEALGGHAAILAVIAPGEEPTEHFISELIESKEALRGVPVRLIVDTKAQLCNEKLQKALREVEDIRALHAPDQSALLAWREMLHAGDLRLPFAIAVDGAGNGLHAYVNYHVGSVLSLRKILKTPSCSQ